MLPSDACTGSPGWMSRGACQDQDPELFFPIADTGPALQQISAAKAVCGRCAVRAMCLSYALRSAQYGIWGGTTPEERRAMRQPSGWNSASIRPAMVGAPRAAPAAAAAAHIEIAREMAAPAGHDHVSCCHR